MRTLSMILAGVLLLTWSSSVAGHAAVADPLISASDVKGDVEVFPSVKGLTSVERRSIDLREVEAASVGGAVHFTVRMKSILRTRDFDQMIFISMTPAATSRETWIAQVGMSPQNPILSYAYFSADDSNGDLRSCDPLKATVLRGQDSVRIEVPDRCIPQREARIKITSSTGYFRSDAGSWSSDAMRVPGAHLLR